MKKIIFSFCLIILITNTGFAQWFIQYYNPNNWLEAVYFLDNQRGWAVGDGPNSNNGTILRTTNGGFNWVQQPFLGNFWQSINFINEQIGFLGGEKLFKTTDGGNSWNQVFNMPQGQRIFSIYFIDSLRGWIAGGRPWWFGNLGSFFGYTINGGDSWTEIPISTNKCLLSISFSDSLHGFAVGDDQLMVKTTDGGTTWNITTFGSLGTILLSIQFISDLYGWISGYPYIYRTTNGGINWTAHLVDPNHITTYNTVFFVDSLHGYTCSNADMFYSSNGGINWIRIEGGEGEVTSIYFIDQQEGWAVNRNGLILHTTNGGEIPVELISFTFVVFDRQIKLNWSTSTEINNRCFEIERSSNKTDWRTIGFKEGNGTTTEIHNYSFIDDLFGTSSQKLYYRLKQIDFDGSFEYSDIVEVSVVTEFNLLQNYPNPFNPTTKIRYSILNVTLSAVPAGRQGVEGSFVTLKVYDVLGKEIAALVNEEKQPGVYEVEFDASKLSSGIYFYTLQAGDFNQTKKLVFMK